MPLKDKTSDLTSRAFYEQVLSRYGSCAEVLTDQGGEWKGEFANLMDRMYIDHRQTSHDHPQADGLAERLVQTIKQALRKALLDHPKTPWDELLPKIVFAYRCSKQASLGKFSPYFMMYGRNVGIPGIAHRKMENVIDFQKDPEMTGKIIADRAVLLEHVVPLAFDNLVAAQHRDTLRYAYTRSGIYRPRLKKFLPGDYAYLYRARKTTLDPGNTRTILKFINQKPTGVVLLEGADGRQIEDHIENLAPCHLPELVKPGEVPRQHRTPDELVDDIICEVCGRADDEAILLLCDECNAGYHKFCLNPPLARRPRGNWFCPAHEETRVVAFE